MWVHIIKLSRSGPSQFISMEMKLNFFKWCTFKASWADNLHIIWGGIFNAEARVDNETGINIMRECFHKNVH